ncbi:MAG: hypothetical protein CBB72_012455 [Muricauda sp. TMED12]|nr:MAG: hypothetical protein CBB72_012455 [Muricauda sp. TMED12]
MIVQIFMAMLLLGPMVWGVFNLAKSKGTVAPKGVADYGTLINSAVLYALAFNIIYFLQELFLVLGKKALGLKAFLYHNDHNWSGEHPKMLLMQGLGALGIFLIGLICLYVQRYISDAKGIWKLFLLWMAFQGLVQSIPQVMISALDPGTDVGEALVGYLKLDQSLLTVFGVVCAMTIALICIYFSRLFLAFGANTIDYGNTLAKLKYIRFIAVGAALLGSILVVPFKVPPMRHTIAPFMVFIFSIPWVWSSASMDVTIHPVLNDLHKKVYRLPIVFLILLLLFFHLVLAKGVEF